MPERHAAAPATTDQTTKQNLDPKPAIEQGTKSWHDLSAAQVVGGALAAMTAAALGSRLSLAGTVIGAALASVIAAVSGSLYTASLRRTRQTVRAVIGGRLTDTAGSPSGQAQPVSGVSSVVAPSSLPSLDRSARASRRRGLVVRSVVGAAAIFALAGGALTIYEAASGHALSGGGGTTLSQVQQGGRQSRPADEQAPTPSESGDPSTTAEPSATPSVTPQAEPSSTAEPSAGPTAEPSTESSVTPQAEPSATAPPTAAPSQSQPSR